MNRIASTLLLATLVAAFGQSAAHAELIYTTNTFAGGTDFSYNNVYTYNSLPYTLLSAHLVCDISEFRRPLLVQKS